MARKIPLIPTFIAGIAVIAAYTLLQKLPDIITPEGNPTPTPGQEGPNMRFFHGTNTLAVSGTYDNGAMANFLTQEGIALNPLACSTEIVQLNAARLVPTGRMIKKPGNDWQWELKNTIINLGPLCTNGPEAQ